MVEIRAKLYFIEELLGTCAANKELHSEYIASKAPDAQKRDDEIAAIGVEAATEKAMTVFPRNQKGEKMKGSANYLAAYKSKIDNLVFIKAVEDSWKDRDHGIVIHTPAGVDSPDCQRPLRAATPMGDRNTLAHSETCPADSWVMIDILTRDDSLESYIRTWLDSGYLYGIGQWRNSGKGRFLWEEIGVDGNVIGGNRND